LTEPAYKDIIRETYIDPIRSVIAVDDEYPTLDAMLPDVTWSGDKKNAERLKGILEACRKRHWMFDVHDGDGLDPSVGDVDLKHLHQTDLLILDYQLEGEGGTGERAREILKKLATNDHFNVVVIYTNRDPIETFNEVLFSLMTAARALEVEHDEAIGDFLDGLSDGSEDDQNQFNLLMNFLDDELYKQILWLMRGRDEFPWKGLKELPLVKFHSSSIGNKVRGKSFSTKDLFCYLFLNYQKKLLKSGKISRSNNDEIRWVETVKNDENWLRTDRLFVTVISKSVGPADLIQALENALCAWCPTPIRLLISQLRTQLEEAGGAIEDRVLKNRFVQAGWLTELLRAKKGEEQRVIISEIASRQWDSVLADMVDGVSDKFEMVVNYEKAKAGAPAANIKAHFDGLNIANADTQKDITANLNSYVSTKPVEGAHLMTGHVIEISHPEGSAATDSEYYICLTPACDLVPKKRGGRYERLTPVMPFKAVKIEPFNRAKALERANETMSLFLPINGEIFYGHFLQGANLKASPEWEEMFAQNQGRIGDKYTLDVARSKWCDENKCVITQSHNAKIVAQLHYEYALNLLHRLGSSMSRVGLDFRTPDGLFLKV